MFKRRLITELLAATLVAIATPAPAAESDDAKAPEPSQTELQNEDALKPGDIRIHAVALDGDTLLITEMLEWGPPGGQKLDVVLGRTRVRLWGIDTPEMKERDGWYARGRLDDLIEGGKREITCRIFDLHKKRLVGRCFATIDRIFQDLAERMLSDGYAVTYRTFTHAPQIQASKFGWIYDISEAFARENRRGLWSRAPTQ